MKSVPGDYVPLLIQTVIVFGFVSVTMLLTHRLTSGNRRIDTRRKAENFECGIEVKGNARIPFSVKYFLVAILFVLFDVEIIFFYPWAVNFIELGWEGFWGMLTFAGLLLCGFFYLMKKGAFRLE